MEQLIWYILTHFSKENATVLSVLLSSLSYLLYIDSLQIKSIKGKINFLKFVFRKNISWYGTSANIIVSFFVYSKCMYAHAMNMQRTDHH